MHHSRCRRHADKPLRILRFSTAIQQIHCHASAFAIYAEMDAVVILQQSSERQTGELAALISIEDIRFTMFGYGLDIYSVLTSQPCFKCLMLIYIILPALKPKLLAHSDIL